MTAEAAVHLVVRDRVAVLTLDNPPVNALSAAARAALAQRLDALFPDANVDALVLAGSGPHFSAGADIREFRAASVEPLLTTLIERIESAPKPVVAALHGTTAGGALELALGCQHRVAAEGASLALPEVTLGFVPGAGGTQRLPRLVGLEPALEMILEGRRLGADEARRIGLVDDVAPGADLIERAIALARSVVGRPLRRTGALPAAPPSRELFERLEAGLRREARGRQAPLAALELVRTTLALPFTEGLRREREAFLGLVRGPESRALRHVFFAEREAQKVPGLGGDAAPRSIRSVGIVGFGTMGSGIAMAFANAGLPVVVVDETREALERGLAKVRASYEGARAKGRLTQAECEERIAGVRAELDWAALAGAELVIEAAFEELDVKRSVFARLDDVCGEGAILATNTSSLDVNSIAAATRHPARVLGLHFFSPANIMKLVEVVRPVSVSPDVLASSLEVVKRIGKIGVVVGVCDGFVGNRMLYAYRRQADFLLEEGALPQQVDGALRDFGMAMGPFQTGDLAGLDISWRIRKRQAATRDPGLRYSPIADRLCEMGRFGQKTGAGWYRYEKGSRKPVPDPEVDALVRSVSIELGCERREVAAAEIVERCFAALVNEGASILEQGLAARAGDVDVIWIHGYGFPRHRGGPMHWAEEHGLGRILDVVERLHSEQGALVRPSELLRRLVREGGGFSEPTPPTGANS